MKAEENPEPEPLPEEEKPLPVEVINANRSPWNDEKRTEIIEALESGELTEMDWAKSELYYYRESGINEVEEIIEKYKL